MLIMFVLSCKTAAKPGAWLGRPPSGSQQAQDASLALSAGSHSVNPSLGGVQAG